MCFRGFILALFDSLKDLEDIYLKHVTKNPTNSSKPNNLLSLVDPYNIKEAAYYKWVRRGRQPGGALQDWLEAESEMKAEVYREK